MGEILNAALEEIAYQLGLDSYVRPPAPLSEEVMFLGDERYTESCSPYAYSTGSLKDSLLKISQELESRALRGEKVQPHRIVLVMLHGEGPCTFGWYSLVQKENCLRNLEDVWPPMATRLRWQPWGWTAQWNSCDS